MKIKLSLIVAFVIMALGAKAQIYFQNNTNEPVYLAFSMYHDSNSSQYWGSEGWWKVEPGDKIMISSSIGFQDNIYYYAYSSISKKEYSGDVNLLVHPSKSFEIKNADKSYNQKENPEYVFKKFRHVNMKQGAFQLKYTIELNY
jgi:uncharacterized membrane protein